MYCLYDKCINVYVYVYICVSVWTASEARNDGGRFRRSLSSGGSCGMWYHRSLDRLSSYKYKK